MVENYPSAKKYLMMSGNEIHVRRMKPKTRFMKMYYKMPANARKLLVYRYWGIKPMSLTAMWVEVKNDTEHGKKLLKELGFEER